MSRTGGFFYIQGGASTNGVSPKRADYGATMGQPEDLVLLVDFPIRTCPETRYVRLLSGC